jgi:hypothetical protein
MEEGRNGRIYEHWRNYKGKLICHKCWTKTPEEKRKRSSVAARNRVNNPQKWYARETARNSKLAKSYCQDCGVKGVRLEMHHSDYCKPLEVITLCCLCHKKIHKKKKVQNG